jgi:DNA polymerase-3 subunit beta
MKLRINRAELLTELAPMQGIVERKSTIPVLSHLLLRARDGKLHLAATDLDVSLTSWCDAQLDGDGALAVQARKFLEIVRAMVGDEIELELEDSNQLRIVSGKSKFKIHGLSAEDFPSLPDVGNDEGISIPYSELKRMISKILFAVSAEESRFQLNGALLKMKDGSVEIVATDGHRLALVEGEQPSSAEADGVLVPRKALQELQRFEDGDDVTFRRGEHHLSFKVGRRELICRILEGTFPDYERVISKDNDKTALFDRKELGAVVHRVALLTGDRARAVRMRFSPDLLVVSAANPDLGEAVEELPCSYDGPEFELGINPDYLAHFLSAVETEKVELQLKDENSQCVGVPVEGADQRYLCVIMPMRI